MNKKLAVLLVIAAGMIIGCQQVHIQNLKYAASTQVDNIQSLQQLLVDNK